MTEWFESFMVWIWDPWNFLSVLMSTIGFVATVLNAERNKFGFVLWLVTDLYFCTRFFIIGEYAQSALFFAYFILVIRGIFAWTKKEVQNKKAVEKAAETGVTDFEEKN